MKNWIFFVVIFVNFSSFAESDMISGLCNGFKKKERQDCIERLTGTGAYAPGAKSAPKIPTQYSRFQSNIRYISFKWGGSACPNVNSWKRFIDNPNSKGIENCFYLREKQVVYGVLDEITYKGSDLIKVKDSAGRYLWLDKAGVYPVLSSKATKPTPWHTQIRTADGQLVSDHAVSPPKRKEKANAAKKKDIKTVNYGTRTKGGGWACLSEKWYDDLASHVDTYLFDSYVKSKKCILLKKNIPVTLLDTEFFSGKASFRYRGVKFWANRRHLIIE